MVIKQRITYSISLFLQLNPIVNYIDVSNWFKRNLKGLGKKYLNWNFRNIIIIRLLKINNKNE